jgi:hypothetical protein
MTEVFEQTVSVIRALTDEEAAEYAASIAASQLDNLLTQLCQQRNGLLASSDWTQLPDSPLNAEMRAQWATYRQALRDLPIQQGYPHEVVWPAAPVLPGPNNTQI